MHSSTSIAEPVDARQITRRRIIWVLLALYSLALAAVAFWPVPVDSGIDDQLGWISRVVPWLTYDVIESTANVLLFVPLGILLTMLLRRHRWLVVLISLIVTMSIEWFQGLLLDERTSSVLDVAANLCGAVIGLAIVLAVELLMRSRRRA